VTQRKSVTLQAVTQVAQYVRVTRLDSIKSRILALAVLGTLVPAGITLGVAYVQNRRALEAKITQDLVSESSQTARAISVWVKEQLYDLRVYATSEEVLTNIGSVSSLGFASPRLLEYLRSLQQRATGFEQLAVLDPSGRVVASSVQQRKPVRLPTDWQRTLRQQEQLVGEAYWDSTTSRGKLILAVPVRRSDGRMLGAFAAEINLAPVQAQLRTYLGDSTSGAIYLVSDSGRMIASSREISEALLGKGMPVRRLEDMARRDTAATTYISVSGTEVLGTLRKVPRVPWSVVSEVSAVSALEQVQNFRNFGLLVVALLLLVVAGTAYRLGLIIVRPLERLTRGAAEVASGDFDVDLPKDVTVSDAGEVGALTSVFTHMVSRLRTGRQELASANQSLRAKNEELERLSVTDGLTGLVNHRALMQRLHEEGIRARRTNRAFSVIMADVDHFKQYNDGFGHPAGDVVLKQVAALLKESTRTVDCVARYGGEEFAVLLPETEMSGALEVAERIRTKVERADFPNRKVTLSIGVAEFPRDAETTNEIIVVADAALYVAKHNGRNQVAQAGAGAAGPQRLPRPSGKRKAVTSRKKS
jgi:diguanylate cyclase (GGDEF)-like protein